MVELPFDVERPPDDPPDGVTEVMLWRVSLRVYRDHEVVVTDRWELPTCALCLDRWPCFGRRLGLRGLFVSCRPVLAQRSGPAGGYS